MPAPARTSSRAASTTSTRKSSAQPSDRGPAVFIPEEPSVPTSSSHLRANIVEIFADSQRSATGHRKLVVRLRKIQEVCCGLRFQSKKGEKQQEDAADISFSDEEGLAEKEFNTEGHSLRLQPIKADYELFGQGDPDETQTLPETPTSRLTFSVASTIIPLMAAKDRVIRYRATQIITHIVNSLDSIDDELYLVIRQGLVKRIRDKEPAVRVQAVLGLGRLVGNGEDDDEEDGNDGTAALLERLLEVMQHDTSAEVRRTLLLNLPLTPTTLPYLLERARDLDAPTRRALYSRLLPTLGDFRHLSLTMREKLLRWGIRDRDENVRKATGRLFSERWIEDCAGTPQTDENGEPIQGKISEPTMGALKELLERIDVVNSGMEGGIAHEAMNNFWEGRPDYREAVVFDEHFWQSLTPETIFMARSFNDFCRVENEGKFDDLADEKMPEVTALAFYLHKYATILLSRLEEPNDDEADRGETVECEFIVEQLLYISLTLDYSDEVGRRKMFSLLRETLAVPNLPDEVTKLTVEVLRCVCGPDASGESEFCGVVLEAVAEVHDTIVSEDSFVSAKSELSEESSTKQPGKKRQSRSESPEDEDENESGEPFNKEEAKAKVLREIMINMKCLYIAQCMLQNVEGNLQDNMHLVTMLNNLVVPAVRSHEAPIRERGLECLGLCCLLDKTLAEENMVLFIHCYSKGHEALQETAIRILADILAAHPTLLLPVPSQNEGNSVVPPPFHKPLLKVFAKALKTTVPAEVQTAAVTALSKLLLTNTLSPSGPTVPPSIRDLNENSIDTLLQALLLSYFHPRTRSNLALRQALTYFFPVYCHSRLSNAHHMRKIAVPVVRLVLAAADEFYSLEAEEDSDGEIDETVGEKEVKALMAGVVGMLTEWTDDRRIIGFGGEAQLPGLSTTSITATPPARPADSLHLALTRDILQRILGVGSMSAASKEEKKHLLSMLSKLYIPPPPTATPSSRAGSRVPEGADDFRSSTRSGRTDADVGGVSGIQEPDEESMELLGAVKELLDQAITGGVATDATGRNALVKAKNSVLKLIATFTAIKAEKERDREAMRSRRSVSVVSSSSAGSGAGPRRGGRDRNVTPMIKEEDEEGLADEVSVAGTSRSGGNGSVNVSGLQDEHHHDDDNDDDGEGDDTIIAIQRVEGEGDTTGTIS
ncbi:hypothetical protein AJ80_03688 [Polytolypa hystricis UAMH7299]|uniref:Nuclear condensin complex subunit 3 C-terminal domain-containing protein n=1 Tax=Polytolypa hystricis (strain UAMH7299) TaxID=1447883 RepID=A0A2B7YG06_POLH7|nr:hypothetical protein AJ80_03688 [Polytolypa hystricis UAMH7299]